MKRFLSLPYHTPERTTEAQSPLGQKANSRNRAIGHSGCGKSTRMMRPSTPTMIFQVLLPYLYPTVATGLKAHLPTAMLMLVMAEMYGATSGLGYFVINYTNYTNYTNVVAGIIMVGIVVTILDFLVGLLVRKTVRWS